ncbi:hypothetical protein Fot_24959 [Forsythia ovata]|uniref:Uncharacterized protein n=1 Tax=Forsythia ovata TaxID=205694 RepID=A0ABD1U7P4_9LAMI
MEGFVLRAQSGILVGKLPDLGLRHPAHFLEFGQSVVRLAIQYMTLGGVHFCHFHQLRQSCSLSCLPPSRSLIFVNGSRRHSRGDMEHIQGCWVSSSWRDVMLMNSV